MPRVQKLYDGTDVALVDSSGNLQVIAAANSGVDIGDVTLTAGTASIGKLGANSGVDIGDVDVTSIAAGTNLIGKVSIDQVTANANEVVLKAGTASIGILGANSGVDIGDVDVTSIAAGTNLIGKVSIDQVTANANEVVLKAGTAEVGKLAAGTAIIGSLGGLGIHVAATAVASSAVGADVDAMVAAQAGLRLCGISCKETAAAAAVFVVKHAATGATGVAVQYVTLAANGTATFWYGSDGVNCTNGISIDYVSGTFDVTALYKVVA